MRTKLIALAIAFLFVVFAALAQQAAPAPPVADDDVNILEAITAMVKQVVNSPSSLMVIIALSIVVYLIEVVPHVPSWLIPYVCFIGGGGVYFLFTSPGTVPPEFPYPGAVLFLNGMICGGVALVLHEKVVNRWLIKKTPAIAPPSSNP